MKKDAFEWNAIAVEAFKKLKTAMVHPPPVLVLPYFTKGFMIECDACGVGIGVVLMQNNQSIAFFSQAFKGRNLLFSTYEKELLALVVTIKMQRPYLFGSIFIICTNHHSFKYLLEQKVGTSAKKKMVIKTFGL